MGDHDHDPVGELPSSPTLAPGRRSRQRSTPTLIYRPCNSSSSIIDQSSQQLTSTQPHTLTEAHTSTQPHTISPTSIHSIQKYHDPLAAHRRRASICPRPSLAQVQHSGKVNPRIDPRHYQCCRLRREGFVIRMLLHHSIVTSKNFPRIS
jgi:hypothetical protein